MTATKLLSLQFLKIREENKMMDELQLFNFEGKEIRALEIDGQPYFVGKDAAEILGYARTAKAIQDHVDDDDVKTLTYKDSPKTGLSKLWKNGDYKDKKFINESGLYALIFGSKLPSAERFKHWVTSEVLPTIRKHGAYMTPEKIEEVLLNPDTVIKLAKELKRERENRLIAEKKVIEYEPKAKYCDTVLQNKKLVTITQIAKDYGMSGQEMNRKLHDLKVIFKQDGTWLLYSKYQDKGWTQSETFMARKPDGTQKAVLHTKWTQRGRLGLYELLKKHGILPLIEREENN